LAVLPIGIWWGRQHIVEPAREGRIEIEPSSLELGAIWETEQFPWRVRLHNPTSQSIEIVEIALPPGQGQATPTHCTLPPRETQDIDLTLNLASFRVPQERRFEHDESSY
jgi:hypothetical protein